MRTIYCLPLIISLLTLKISAQRVFEPDGSLRALSSQFHEFYGTPVWFVEDADLPEGTYLSYLPAVTAASEEGNYKWMHVWRKRQVRPRTLNWGGGDNVYVCNENEYQTVVFDDFNGPEIDTAIWYTAPQNISCNTIVHATQNCGTPHNSSFNRPENVVVRDGHLYLQTRKLDRPFEFSCFECIDSVANFYPAKNDIELNYSTGQIATRNLVSLDNPEGCYRFGRFSARLRLPPAHQRSTAAFWFWGWAGEIDVFEMCMLDCDSELQTNIHAWGVKDPENTEAHLTMDQDIPLPDFTDFHVYEMEWTPYKIVMRIDGKVMRQFYRFYKKESFTTSGPDTTIAHTAMIPVECDDLNPNVENEVYEHVAWNRFARFRLDMILGTSYRREPRTATSAMVVDWVKVEQRVPEYKLTHAPEPIDLTAPRQYRLQSMADNAAYWEASENLEIIHSDSIGVTVRLNDPFYPEPSWIRLNALDTLSSCHFREKSWPIEVIPPFERPQFQLEEFTCSATSLTMNFQDTELPVSCRVEQEGIDLPVPVVTQKSGGYEIEVRHPNIDPTAPQQIQVTTTITDSGGETYEFPYTFLVNCSDRPLMIFPNPTTDRARILLADDLKARIRQSEPTAPEIRLRNFSGRLIDTQTITDFGEFPISLDLRAQPPGLYLIELLDGGRRLASGKVVKH